MKTYHGSCFCGAVAFEADGDLADGTMRCNCRFCRKMRYWEMLLPDPDGLRLLRGADALAETPRMQDDGLDMHHVFCGRTMVFVPALDDVPEEELIAVPVFHADGAHDDWTSEARETRHL